MEKLTVNLLAEKYGFSFVANSHALMTDGKGCIIDVYGNPFKINGDNVVTVDELENRLGLIYGSEEKAKRKTAKA
jgi:hypothetical protein